jgi:hypothetical protein
VNRDYLAASGATDGGEWVAPSGAHNAYPEGWTVTHEGKTWVSLTPANVWRPGESGWREAAPENPDEPVDPDEPPFVPEWVQPSGAHDMYHLGDLVMHDGRKWRSIVDNNTWPPGTYGWEPVE